MRIILVLACTFCLAGLGCSKNADPGAEPDASPAGETVDAGAVQPDQPDQPDQPEQPTQSESKAPPAKGESKDGLRQGVWTFFHENGKKAAEGGYDRGLKHGKWIFWYDNGNKTAEGEFAAGRKHGTWSEYDEQGGQAGQQAYDNGQEVYR